MKHTYLHIKINPSQDGFRNMRSCLSPLLEHQDHILSNLEEGHNVDSIYLDVGKAFNNLDLSSIQILKGGTNKHLDKSYNLTD